MQALSAVTNLRLSVEETIRLALEKIVMLADLDMARLLLWRQNRLDEAGVRFSERVPGTNPQACTVEDGLCGLAVRDGRSVYASDIERDVRCSGGCCQAGGLRSVVALPLRGGEAIIGVLALGSVIQDDLIDRLAFLETAAEQIAVGLQNALLQQEIQERAAGLEEVVTERTRELQTERDRTQAILDTLGESVVVTDLDGQMLFLNPATAALTGFSRNESLGLPLWRHWSAQSVTQTWPEAQRALRAGQTWQGEITGHRQDGGVYIAQMTGTPLYDESAGSHPVGGVWVQRDVTAIKEAERLKDQFVSNVSHELRTPIAIIAFSCENLDTFYDRLDEGQRRQMLQDIHKQAYVLNDLVEDTLLLSQIDSGRMPNTRSQVDLAGLVSEEVARQRPFADDRSQQLTGRSGAPVVVLGNSVQLRQVARNLLDNAIKYTPAGDRSFARARRLEPRYAGRASPAPGTWAVIEVHDDGIGIPPDAVPSLFERFFRVNGEEGIRAPGWACPLPGNWCGCTGAGLT